MTRSDFKTLFLGAKKGDKVALLALYEAVQVMWQKCPFCDPSSAMEHYDWVAEADAKFFEDWHTWNPNGKANFSTYMFSMVFNMWKNLKRDQTTKKRVSMERIDLGVVQFPIDTDRRGKRSEVDPALISRFGIYPEDEIEKLLSLRDKLSKDPNKEFLVLLLDTIIRDGEVKTSKHYVKEFNFTNKKMKILLNDLKEEILVFASLDSEAFNTMSRI